MKTMKTGDSVNELASNALLGARRLEVIAEVRYWEDAEVNGEEDTEEGDLIPLKVGDLWKISIDLEEGRILDWPEGTTAAVHYKVCDQGEYWLADADGNRLFKWASAYVPDELLCVGEHGYGDYIILGIAGDGRLPSWTCPELDPSDWIKCA